jgi:adenylate cyclase
MSEPAPRNEEAWRALLTGPDPMFARSRALFQHIPHEPRCKMCAAPFAGPGAPLMRLVGMGRWSKNPKYCARCKNMIEKRHGGAEIESTFLFADMRGSTAMGEQLSPTEFREMLDRFYGIATRELVDSDAIIDKFVGDEVVAIFIPALNGERHAAKAVEAARRLLAATVAASDGGKPFPIGIGVNTGVAFVGAVGDAANPDMTALGDAVNTAARLASAAGAREILVSSSTAAAAGLQTDALEHRALELKGKQLPTDVYVLA